METMPRGEEKAIYEFKDFLSIKSPHPDAELQNTWGIEACYHLISGVATIAAAIARNRKGLLPLEPDPSLGHAANFLYMMNGRRPTPVEERVMDISLILHADHGMNASTFASVVTASTLADVYLSVGSGIAALSGPLHGGANEEVVKQLKEIGDPANVKSWIENKLASKKKISGFGHRVYKAYDPRARVLGPLAACLSEENPKARNLYNIAVELEKEMATRINPEKKIFPNVDFYSGIVYSTLGIDAELFTPIFAVSRVAGWTARVIEYLSHNRIFRPRAIYSGEFNKKYAPIDSR
jgi:citrate synthase